MEALIETPLGMANVAGGLLGAMPSGGGTTQTAVNQLAGARTQLAEVVTAALALAEELVRSAPGRPGYRSLLGEVWVARAGLAARPDALDTCVDRAMSSFRAARNREPENPAHARSLDDVSKRWPEAAARVAARRKGKDGKP